MKGGSSSFCSETPEYSHLSEPGHTNTHPSGLDSSDPLGIRNISGSASQELQNQSNILERGCYTMTNPWLPYELPRMKAYILAPGVVQIGEVVYHLPENREERASSPPENFEFIVPVKENSRSAARAAMEGLYRIVFD